MRVSSRIGLGPVRAAGIGRSSQRGARIHRQKRGIGIAVGFDTFRRRRQLISEPETIVQAGLWHRSRSGSAERSRQPDLQIMVLLVPMIMLDLTIRFEFVRVAMPMPIIEEQNVELC